MTSSEPVPGATTFPAAPSPQAPADEYAPTTWGHYDEELIVPSGQKCRVRKLDFGDMLERGMLDRINTLDGVVNKHIRKGEGQPPIDPVKMLSDKRTARQFTDMLDEVVEMVITRPVVKLPPKDFNDRKPGIVYTDTIQLVDKMEVFMHAIGDVAALENFRGLADKSAQRMANEPGDEGSSQ